MVKSEEDRIAELEKALAKLTMREIYLEKLVELAGEEIGMDPKNELRASAVERCREEGHGIGQTLCWFPGNWTSSRVSHPYFN